MNLEIFNKKKQKLTHYIQETIDIAEKLKVNEISQYLQATMDQLEKEAFTLTVVGEFSRGKSTFINALLGKNVLPSKVKPTTAMINKVFYNESPTFSLAFREDSTLDKVIDEKEFRKLCAPREADEDDKEDLLRYREELELFEKVSMAEIGYPNHFCKAGVEIYDTPGTNDIDIAREEITFSFVPKSDAVIFLLSATTPFGATEMEFLQERILNEHINKVFFVINFKDRLITEQDEQKVTTYIYDKLQLLLPNPKIYLVSSLDALTIRRLQNGEQFRIKSQRYHTLLETGLTKLETDLSHFFQYEKGQTKLEKPIRRIEKKIKELTSETIALRIAASEMEIEEINRKIADLSPKVDQFKQNSRKIIEQLSSNLKSEKSTLIKEIESLLRSMSESMIQSLDKYTGPLKDKEVKIYLKKQSKSHQSEIQSKINKLKHTIVEEHLSHAYKLLNSEEKALNKAVQDTFNLEIEMNYNFDLSQQESTDDILGMAIGAAGIGFSALILAPALIVIGGVGAAIGAIFFGDSILDAFTDYRRNKRIDEIKKQVRASLQEGRVEIKNKFHSEWNTVVRKIEFSFEKEVHEKTLRLQQELHEIRLEKETEKYSIEDQKKYYKSLSSQLEEIKSKASFLLNEGFQEGVRQ